MRRATLIAFILLLLPTAALAAPITVAGFGDSITCNSCNDGSYMSLLENYLAEPPITLDNGISADRTSGVLSRLDTWLMGGGTADVVVLLTGTPDLFMEIGGFTNSPYNEAQTVANIQAALGLLDVAGLNAILVAPPPVQAPCDYAAIPSCATIAARAGSLATQLAALAVTESVSFVNLFDAFSNHPDIGEVPGSVDSLFLNDGVHPQYATGDELIAFEIAQAILAIPEPSTGVLTALGLVAITLRRRTARARSL